MQWKYFALIIFLLIAMQAHAALPPARDKLHLRLQWQRFFYASSHGKSLEVSGKFFLDPSGKDNLAKELETTVALLRDPQQRQSVVCRFPARSRWLVEELHLPLEILEVPCPQLETYRQQLGEGSVWVVFASYYLNTPASAFGHTFLRFSSQPPASSSPFNDLLDYSVNFAAHPDTSNPLSYAIKGMSGQFVGTFSALPYYYKIREYNDFESRDLWSYRLNLTAEQRAKLVDLIWELDHAQFAYFYLSKNCSYFLLALLEAISEDFHFLEHLPFYIIPIDTIKALKKRPNFVTNIAYRPSARVRFWYEYGRLSPEKRKLYQLMALKEPSSTILALPDDTKKELFDLALSHFDYLYPKDMLDAKGEAYLLKRKYLEARSQILQPSPSFHLEPLVEDYPDGGHSGRKATFALGYLSSKMPRTYERQFAEVGLRFAFHELDDPPEGHFSSNLDMFDLRLRAYRKDTYMYVRMHSLTLLDIFSINPVNDLESNVSWKFQIAAKDFIDHDCFHCYGLRLASAVGLVFKPFHKDLLLYSLLAASFDAFETKMHPKVDGRLRLGPQFGLWGHGFFLQDSWRIESQHHIQFKASNGKRTYGFDLNAHYDVSLARNFRIGLNASLADHLTSTSIKAAYYF